MLGLVIVLLVFTLLWLFVSEEIKSRKPASPAPPEPPKTYTIAFHGGPLDGLKTDAEEKDMRDQHYVPHIPDGYVPKRFQVAGVEMQEPLFAKYVGIAGTGDYFFIEDITREEYVREIGNGG